MLLSAAQDPVSVGRAATIDGENRQEHCYRKEVVTQNRAKADCLEIWRGEFKELSAARAQ